MNPTNPIDDSAHAQVNVMRALDAIKDGQHVVAEAFRAFYRWSREHDPDGNMDVEVAAAAYHEWASKNDIEKYMDAAQPSRSHT